MKTNATVTTQLTLLESDSMESEKSFLETLHVQCKCAYGMLIIYFMIKIVLSTSPKSTLFSLLQWENLVGCLKKKKEKLTSSRWLAQELELCS